MMTREEANELFDYDQDTGVLRWKKSRSNVLAGDVAGHKTTDGYIDVRVNRRLYSAHRIVWLLKTSAWPDGEIDHIDGDRSNNRLLNLRDVDRRNNAKNQRLNSRNKSGTMGVRFHSRDKRWEASIGCKRTLIFLGCFSTKEEAVAARKDAERKYGYHANHGRVSVEVTE